MTVQITVNINWNKYHKGEKVKMKQTTINVCQISMQRVYT